MTKKDYIVIAQSINEAIEMEGDVKRVNPVIEHIIDTLVIEFQIDNPLFDEERFREMAYK